MKNASDKKIEMTADEQAFIDRFVADYCRPHRVVMAERLAKFVAERQMAFVKTAEYALAAGPRRTVAKATSSPVAPDEEVRFAFASEGVDADAWRAELRVPPKATAETMLTIKVCDSSDQPANGVFSLAGCALPITDGTAEMPFGLFLAGIQNTEVGLCRPGGHPVAGRLLFF